jgi:hypothetical protein
MLENHVDHIPIPREELLEDVEERLDEEKDEELAEGVNQFYFILFNRFVIIFYRLC